MGKPKNTLTDWPEDLKDVIDWFLRLAEMDEGGSGYSNKTKLKKAVEKLNGFSKEQFGKFMSTMGFDTTRLNGNIQGNQVATLLAEEDIHCFSEFTNPQKSTYEAFLTNLEQSAIGSAINHPLASCYKVAEKYFESQKANGKHITQPIKAIKDNLIQLSATEEYSSSGDSSTNPYDNLKRLITQLLSAVQKFQAKEPEQFGPDVHHAAGQAGKVSGAPGGQPSSGGSIAGALTTLGLGGGATAAYIFNIGGAKTIVNGLLKIG
ncbi:variant erythrocyte surface antigen-1a related protein, putative [Babesia caballi]|uniref:Variant erythrocyte surface antigen-1a related protein, putative n=1 Tax=Babesia caballi TaxID=5871 RepID=A0AAV4LS43_BABCB|nr:variant erythrocyte surface antigen-1a related protein, putative [Babesia caballi]